MLGWFSSPLLAGLVIGSFFTWELLELVNSLAIGRPPHGETRLDRGSYALVSLAVNAALLLIVLIRLLRLGLLPGLFQWIGLVLLWAGIFLREWAVLRLGRLFTVMVEVDPNQRLVTSGPYRLVRHPAYTGSILTMGGFGLAAGSWLAALVAVVLVLAAFSYRVRVEENALLAALGDEYRHYMQRTGRFLPRLR